MVPTSKPRGFRIFGHESGMLQQCLGFRNPPMMYEPSSGRIPCSPGQAGSGGAAAGQFCGKTPLNKYRMISVDRPHMFSPAGGAMFGRPPPGAQFWATTIGCAIGSAAKSRHRRLPAASTPFGPGVPPPWVIRRLEDQAGTPLVLYQLAVGLRRAQTCVKPVFLPPK